MSKLAEKPRNSRQITYLLVEPIYRRQPQEGDKDYELFLIYRGLPWTDRNLRAVTAIATNTPIDKVEFTHPTVAQTSAKWQWQPRANAYDLFVREHNSEREEKIRLEMKSDIERLCYEIVGKIKKIERIQSAEEMDTPEMAKNIAVVTAMLGKETSPGKFLLEAYKTIVGQKVQVGAAKKLPELHWNED